MGAKRAKAVEFPTREPSWAVVWWDWRGRHDWIGSRALPRGGAYKTERAKPPERQVREFFNREPADRFAASIRAEIPEDELVLRVIPLPEQRPEPPVEEMLPGVEWPVASTK